LEGFREGGERLKDTCILVCGHKVTRVRRAQYGHPSDKCWCPRCSTYKEIKEKLKVGLDMEVIVDLQSFIIEISNKATDREMVEAITTEIQKRCKSGEIYSDGWACSSLTRKEVKD
jgi:hypothetical protein